MNNQKIDRPFANLEPILWKAWIRTCGTETAITGYYAEDDSEYFINAPSCMIPSILQMQNALSKRYLDWCAFRDNMNTAAAHIMRLLKD